MNSWRILSSKFSHKKRDREASSILSSLQRQSGMALFHRGDILHWRALTSEVCNIQQYGNEIGCSWTCLYAELLLSELQFRGADDQHVEVVLDLILDAIHIISGNYVAEHELRAMYINIENAVRTLGAPDEFRE